MPGDGSVTGWLERIPAFDSGSDLLNNVFRQSVIDLAALRISGDLLGEHYVLPAAGLPWFMTLFGRDTLITSLQTLWVGAGLARGALHLLGALQGTLVDDFRDEEPGKIMHEVRSGELTLARREAAQPLLRHRRRDAAVVDPALGVLALHRRRRVRARPLAQRSRRARLDRPVRRPRRRRIRGVRDALVTGPRQPVLEGLMGRRAVRRRNDPTPTHRHRRDPGIRLRREAPHRGARAPARARRRSHERLENEAASLRARFNQDFWSEERGGFYVVGLDGDKRPIDSLTSNIGHLLWSGIVPDERARLVADHLLSDRLFSGWGVRTLSTRRPRLQPDRLPRRHDLAARQLDPRARARPDRLPRRSQPDRARATRSRLVHRPPPPRGICGLRPLDQPLSSALPDRLQPPGLGNRSALRLHPDDARPRGP